MFHGHMQIHTGQRPTKMAYTYNVKKSNIIQGAIVNQKYIEWQGRITDLKKKS